MGIGDDVRRQMEKAVNAAKRDDARGLQRALDRLGETCKGSDVTTARAALERAMRQHHARPTAAQLDDGARRLVNGERIVVKSSEFKLGR
jgi:hypothetical protein